NCDPTTANESCSVGLRASGKTYDGSTVTGIDLARSHAANLPLTAAELPALQSGDTLYLGTQRLDSTCAPNYDFAKVTFATDKNVGTSKSVHVEYLCLYGPAVANYTQLSDAWTHAAITQRPLTVSATADSKP